MSPTASIIVPTRGRPDYLAVALASIAPQAAAAGAEVLVVEDGPTGECAAVAARHGAVHRALGARRGLNAARNAGLRATTGDLVVYVDDDVEVGPGWLAALLAGARAHPGVDVFTGPIRARFDGAAPPGCGREGPPITALDLGPDDGWAPHAWGANMAIRRTAFAAAGEFDAGRSGGGDEEEWQRRHGGPIRYVAAAGLDHHRVGADARLPALARAAFRRGAEARRFDAEAGGPRLRAELRVLVGCLWHAGRRRCVNGLVLAAHAAGRVAAWSPGEDFLSGRSGTVGGRRDAGRELADRVLDLELRLRAPAPPVTPRRVLALTVARAEHGKLHERAAAELRRSAHAVTLGVRTPGGAGKFENVNALLADHPPAGYDWVLVLDDDVELPAGFLDRFLGLAERFDLRLAQPAHRLRSHAAWRLTRRRPASLVRETRFVEIGPVTALHRDTFPALLPFPSLRMGWGLDAHWAALAVRHGWRIGVVDATPIGHRAGPAGEAYSRAEAIAEARAFLAGHDYLPAAESQRTLRVHRRCG